MSDMNFGVNLVPASNNTYSLGNANKQWNLYGHFAPLETKTYTNVIATANDNNGAGFFYMKVRGTTYNTKWYIKTRIYATVPGQELYETDSTFELWGYANTYDGYKCDNQIKSTSYRPIYYNSYFRVSSTGYTNNCGGWVGFNLVSSTNNTNSSYKRTVVVELLDYKNCEVQLQDSLITPTNIPDRASHTGWYSSSNTSFDNFDAASQGLKQSGDANTTTIGNLVHYYGSFIADSVIYRLQLLFFKDADTLTPLNNNNNVTATTKTMLTDVEFDPFGEIFYYNSTTTYNAAAVIPATYLHYSFQTADLRYSFNIASTAFTANKDVYLQLTPTTNGKVKIASATPVTQTLPTTRDGILYLKLGRAYSGYQISLYTEHPIYYYNGTQLLQYTKPQKPYGVNTPPIEFINSSNNSSSINLTGVSTSRGLTNGHIIYYRLAYAATPTSSNLTLNLTLQNNTTTGAIAIYNTASDPCLTPFAAGAILPLIYYDNKFYIASSGLLNASGVSF